MMRALPIYLAVLAFAAGAFAVPQAARAQCRLCDTPTTQGSAEADTAAIRLEVETRLDFDKLIVLGAGEGTATLSPDGTRSTSGVIGAIGGRAMVGSAVIRGEPGRAVRVDLPAQIRLYSLSGAGILIEKVQTDLSPAPRLDSSGRLEFRFGGRLRISGDADGDYRGDVPITVEYL